MKKEIIKKYTDVYLEIKNDINEYNKVDLRGLKLDSLILLYLKYVKLYQPLYICKKLNIMKQSLYRKTIAIHDRLGLSAVPNKIDYIDVEELVRLIENQINERS